MNSSNQPTEASRVARELAQSWPSNSRLNRLVAAMWPSQERNSVSRFTRVYQKLIAQPRWLRRRLTRKARLTIVDIAFMLALGFSLPAAAQNILVNTNIPNIAVDGKCSLIEAINNANADANIHADCPAGLGVDTLTLQSASMQVITGPVAGSANQGLPTITSQIVIQGNGTTLKVAAVPVDTVINVASTGTLTLSDAIITGDDGSGSEKYFPRVQNAGVLQLSNVKVLLNVKRISAITNSGVMIADGLEVNTAKGLRYNGSSSNGHGILNTGNITLSNSKVKNLYNYYDMGAPVVNKGRMYLLNVAISDNSGAGGWASNCGIDNAGVINGSGLSVVSNPGGYQADSGVYNRSGAMLTLKDSVISGNGSGYRWDGFGGFNNAGRAYFERVAVNGNAGGLWNSGFLKSVDGSISGNRGDGTIIGNTGDMMLAGVNVSNNNSGYRSALWSGGIITITNSTISNNSSGYSGFYGGYLNYNSIVNAGKMTITSSTIASNSAWMPGGLINSGSLSLSHSLVAGFFFYDSTGLHFDKVITNLEAGSILANDHNLFGDNSLTTAQAFSGFTPGVADLMATSDGTNPTLFTAIMDTEVDAWGDTVARLADNGGLTPTIALKVGSPALDAAGLLCVPADQRGITRPHGAACDIGAFEWAGAPGPAADLSITMLDSPNPIIKSAGNYLAYTITATNNSSNVAKTVSVIDPLHLKKMSFVSANTTQGACTQTAGVVTCTLGDMAAHTSATVKIYVQPTVIGDIYNAATIASNGADPNHANNIASLTTIALTNGVDLLETFTSNPPTEAKFGSSIPVTDTVQNQGAVAADVTNTRYYLSLDKIKNTGDLLLTGSRNVPSLASGASASGGTNVTISNASVGSYYLLACADDTKVVAESNEQNNCRTSLTTMLIKSADLLETAISNPPSSVVLNSSFLVTDSAMNQGNLAAGPSKTRYYLSLDKVRNTGDRLLTGSRSVTLAPYTSSTGTISVKVPSTTPKKAYYLLSCADDTKAVKEVNEKNNCLASTTMVTVK